MFNPRHGKLILATGLAFIATLFLIHWIDREPTYNGKPVSYWMQGYVGQPNLTEPSSDKAREAVRALGRDAIPTLVHYLDYNGGLISAARSHLAKLKFLHVRSDDWSITNMQAWLALRDLGSNAAPAIPDLIRVYDRTADFENQSSVILLLRGMGPAAAPAIPFLLGCITSTNAEIRELAVDALCLIHSEPERSVRALTACFGDSSGRVRIKAIYGVGEFGKDASMVMPALLAILHDNGYGPGYLEHGQVSDNKSAEERIAEAGKARVIGATISAIWMIDPEWAEKQSLPNLSRDRWRPSRLPLGWKAMLIE